MWTEVLPIRAIRIRNGKNLLQVHSKKFPAIKMTAYVYVLHFSYFFISYQFFSIVVKIQYTYSWKKFQLKKGEYFFFHYNATVQ